MDSTKDKEPFDAKIKSAIAALQDAAVLQGAGKGSTVAIFGASSLLEDLIRDALRAEYQRGIGDAHCTDIQDPPAQPATRVELARAILDRVIADLAAIGVECQASEHRETEVGAAMAGSPVLSLSLSATVYTPDEVIP